jgi:hypothetical protein
MSTEVSDISDDEIQGNSTGFKDQSSNTRSHTRLRVTCDEVVRRLDRDYESGEESGVRQDHGLRIIDSDDENTPACSTHIDHQFDCEEYFLTIGTRFVDPPPFFVFKCFNSSLLLDVYIINSVKQLQT